MAVEPIAALLACPWQPPSTSWVGQESEGLVQCWFLSFSKLVQNVCRGCFAYLRDSLWVRRYLTTDAAILVANDLVSSRLDYCNSLFWSLSKYNLHKLQCIQNSAARIISNTSKYTRICAVHNVLYWLPVEYRFIFKTAVLVYKFIHTGFPRYFSPYLQPYTSTYNTRWNSSQGNPLAVPTFHCSAHKSICQCPYYLEWFAIRDSLISLCWNL